MHGSEGQERPCWRCDTPVGAGLVCPRCEAPQPLPPGSDLFDVLGLPRKLVLDGDDLERRYHMRSRALHPDRHQTGEARARELSEKGSAALNRAYRTLRDPVARGRYWLELHGNPLHVDNTEVPAALAADVFDAQEKLEELRTSSTPELRDQVTGMRDALAARLRALKDDLSGLYAGANGDGQLGELKRRLSEIAYLRTLLGDIEAALGDGRGADSRH